MVATGTIATAAAQERVGIAFSQASELGVGMCFGTDPDDAIGCATRKCMANGASTMDCSPLAWCFPAGWSVDVVLQHNEGPVWHEVSCGWPTRAMAERAASILCDDEARDFIVNCEIANLYDEGVETPVSSN